MRRLVVVIDCSGTMKACILNANWNKEKEFSIRMQTVVKMMN